MLSKEELFTHFWRISCEFYATKGVKKLLLNLQEQQQKNVNHLLFVLWVTTYSGYCFNSKNANQVLSFSAPSQFRVKRIRQLRKSFVKDNSLPLSFFISGGRRLLLKLELYYEKKHQEKLILSLFSLIQKGSDTQVLRKIEQNLMGNTLEIDKTLYMQNLLAICGKLHHQEDYVRLLELWRQYIFY